MQSAITNMMEAALRLLKANGYFVDNLWHVDDVHFISEQLQLPVISNEEAMEVFAIASNQFDGETGISWPELEKALRAYLRRKAAVNEMLEKCPES